MAKPLKPAGEKARSAIAGMLLQRLAPIFDPPKPKIDRRKVKDPGPRRDGGAVKAIEQGLILLRGNSNGCQPAQVESVPIH